MRQVSKVFKYKSMCHSSLAPLMNYKTGGKTIVVGQLYDVYFAEYTFSWEYEIFKDGQYYTSFILGSEDGEVDKKFLRHFYNNEQMIQMSREYKLNKLGI